MPYHELNRFAAGIARLERLHAETERERLAAQLRQNWSWEWRLPTLRLSVRVERVRRHA